ncbi:MAG: hypothetical protein ACRBDL_07710 [Alphaproteobacteria bacterium]
MSEVNPDDQSIIDHIDDVVDLYKGVGRDNAKSGLEVELSFFDPNTDTLDAMSLAQNRVLKHCAMGALPDHDWVHNEPTSELLEVATTAASFDQMQTVLDDANTKIKILHEKAQGLGLKRSYFQELPDKTADDLLSRIVEVDRYQIMYAPYREDMYKCVQYFAVCKSNQVSVSPYTTDHMLENVRRLYTLAPFLFLLTDNSSAFSEGKPFNGHIGMALRHQGLLEGRGGVPPYVFTAKTGEEFIRDHINHAMNNPLFMYYDLDGTLNKVPSGDWSVTFNTLRERGLNTASNYNLGQSILWPDVKIAALRDEHGKTYAHRYEARMFGVGIHQHQTGYIITSALAFNDKFAQDVDDLLARYGFSSENLEESYQLLLKSYAAARNHNGAFFDIQYGNGSMAEFAKEFADLLENVTDEAGVLDAAQPALHICRTGCTDGKVNRLLFKTLDDIKTFQRTYDMEVFDNPNMCARMAFEQNMATSPASLFDAHCT